MSYENLIRLQNTAEILATVCFVGGLAFLIAGLVRTHWVGFSRRRWVVLSALCIWLLGLITYGGVIGYTHSQPNGPHSFESYMDGMMAQDCVRDASHAGCAELAKKCAERDPTHPACRILKGEDASKFYTTTTR